MGRAHCGANGVGSLRVFTQPDQEAFALHRCSGRPRPDERRAFGFAVYQHQGGAQSRSRSALGAFRGFLLHGASI
eukprot:11212204-Lingulodinium_polyedra.AAC.1